MLRPWPGAEFVLRINASIFLSSKHIAHRSCKPYSYLNMDLIRSNDETYSE